MAEGTDKVVDYLSGLVDVDGVQVRALLDEKGREVGDPTPMAPPVGMSRSVSMAERITQIVRREVSARAEALGMETLEEANDFDIPDDPVDPSTPYEEHYDPVESRAAEMLRIQELNDRVNKRHKELRARKYPDEVDNGSSSVVEGRDSADSAGSGKFGEKSKNKSKPKSDVSGSGSASNVSGSDAEE